MKWALRVLGLATLAGAGYAGVFYYSATVIPWVVTNAATIGLDLAFLSSWSIPAASAAITGMGLAALGTATAVTSAAVNTLSFGFSLIGGLFSSSAATPPQSPTTEPTTSPTVPVAPTATNRSYADLVRQGSAPQLATDTAEKLATQQPAAARSSAPVVEADNEEVEASTTPSMGTL